MAKLYKLHKNASKKQYKYLLVVSCRNGNLKRRAIGDTLVATNTGIMRSSNNKSCEYLFDTFHDAKNFCDNNGLKCNRKNVEVNY